MIILIIAFTLGITVVTFKDKAPPKKTVDELREIGLEEKLK